MGKSYISSSLTFYDNKIVVEDSGSNYDKAEVMMDWEHPIMSASAAYVTQGGGDILEIGFGMGIASNYIQSHSISSHTIIENHPQVIEKLETWSSGKSNVTIISQSWYDVKDSLGTFDGIFYDAFGDKDALQFSSSLSNLTNSGAKVTFWNSSTDGSNDLNLSNISYQQVNINSEEVSLYPSTGSSFQFLYFSGSVYHVPKWEF